MEFVIINQPLILISQIQRSGGSLMSQLFDGHDEIYAHPLELKLNDPKWDWSQFTKFYLSDSLKWRILVEQKKYAKGKNLLQEGNDFLFDLKYQKQLFNYINNQKLNDREKLNAYFTSFFNAFKNYKKNNKKKKYVTAFTPRINFFDYSINKFFSIYPDGFFLSIIRHPKNWLASALFHSKIYSDINHALSLWLQSTERSIQIKNKYINSIIINFDNLISESNSTMKKIANKINIEYNDSLVLPSFNGEPTYSNSSFQTKKETIDKETLNRSSYINDSTFKKVNINLYNKCLDTYNLSLTVSLNLN